MAARSMERFKNLVVVEHIHAHAGMDIGDTFIGMHLRSIAVPIRSADNQIGQAHLTICLALTKYIGGPRSLYKD